MESWKRKQATIQYLWGLVEKEDQIKKSVKKRQRGNEYVYDEQRGLARKTVMDDNKCNICCTNFLIITLFSSLACVVAVACVELVGVIEFDEVEEEQKAWWIVFTIFLNAIVVAILTKFYYPVILYIVVRENHGADAAHEESLINKSLIVSSFISFGGLMLSAYWERSFWRVNLLMIFLIIFKQILINAIESAQPNRIYPKLFAEHKRKHKPHCRKYPSSYEEFSMRGQHYEAEQQLLMGEMEATKTENYNELFIEYGWMVLFPPAFPAAGLVAIVSNLLQYKTEREAILKFAQRCVP